MDILGSPDCTVLLIDDEVALLHALASALRSLAGFRVLTASGPTAAAALYDAADVVLTDWNMPDGGGARVLADCRKPVLVYSADDEVRHAHQLRKPATVEEIERALLQTLRQR
jgi:DNA-binding NtrC family response regulator